MYRMVIASTSFDSWDELIADLNNDCETILDPLYEGTDAGDKINDICSEVEGDLWFWLEPSVQAGQGGIWFYDKEDDSTIVSGYDYQTFNNKVIDLAINSKSKAEFKKKYKSYLESIVKSRT